MEVKYSITNLATEFLQFNVKSVLTDKEIIKKCLVVDDYILIEQSDITVFKIDPNQRLFIYNDKIKLKKLFMKGKIENKDEIESNSNNNSNEKILSITGNSAGSIIIMSTNNIYKYDAITCHTVLLTFYKSVNNENKLPIFNNYITSIFVWNGEFFNSNETSNINKDETPVLFTILASGEEGDLLVTKENLEDEENEKNEICLEIVKKFFQKVTSIYFKKIDMSEDKKQDESIETKVFYLIIAFTRQGAYICLINYDTTDLENFILALKKSVYQPIYKLKQNDLVGDWFNYFTSVDNSNLDLIPKSLVAFNINFTGYFCELKNIEEILEEYDNILESGKPSLNIPIIKNVIQIEAYEEIEKGLKFDKTTNFEDLIDIKCYGSLLFIIFPNKVFVYNNKLKSIVILWRFPNESFSFFFCFDLYFKPFVPLNSRNNSQPNNVNSNNILFSNTNNNNNIMNIFSDKRKHFYVLQVYKRKALFTKFNCNLEDKQVILFGNSKVKPPKKLFKNFLDKRNKSSESKSEVISKDNTKEIKEKSIKFNLENQNTKESPSISIKSGKFIIN